MAWIFKELRNWAKKPLDEPQDFADWLVFGDRPVKKKYYEDLEEAKINKQRDELVKKANEERQKLDETKDLILSPSIPQAPPLPPPTLDYDFESEKLSPPPKPFIPEAPPLPQPSLPFIPPPPPPPPAFVPKAPPPPPPPVFTPIPSPPPPFENELAEPRQGDNDLLKSIRQGIKLKPAKKPTTQKPSFLDEIKQPKLTAPKPVKQKPVKEKPLTMNDLLKANKKFQALSRQTETKDEPFVDDFEGWGKKRRRRKLNVRF
jgi:hypothetical protein